MKNNIAVRFIKPKPPYNANEVAGFPEGIVQDLVRNGFAVLHNPGEIEIKPEPEQSTLGTAPKISEFAALLREPKAEIEKAISEKDNDGFFKFSDSKLGNMLAEERQGKARKGVIKAIESEVFGRLNDNA